MLSMLLLLAAPPQTEPAPPSLPLPTIRQLIDAGAIPQPLGRSVPGVIGMTPEHCANPVVRTNDRTASASNLMWREGGQAVGHYRLLDRYVNGCPEPILAGYRVPGSNAVGREVGRDPAPAPGLRPNP